MPKLSEDRYRERRSHILTAARACFAQSGIGISVDEVCEAAGISKGAFYGYFKSKDALFEALARDHGALLQALPPPTDRAALIAMLLERCSAGHPEFARVELDTMAYASHHSSLNAIFIENAAFLSEAIGQALAGLGLVGVDDRLRASRLIEAATLGAFLLIALQGKPALAASRDIIADAVDAVCGGRTTR